jgi:hypothetical protein
MRISVEFSADWVRDESYGITRAYCIFAFFPGNATNNLWVLNLTPSLFDIRQAELQLLIILSTIRNYNNDNSPKVSVITYCSAHSTSSLIVRNLAVSYCLALRIVLHQLNREQLSQQSSTSVVSQRLFVATRIRVYKTVA